MSTSLYNQEVEAMKVINLAHACKGIFKSNKRVEDGIYLDLLFDDRFHRRLFVNAVTKREIGKKVLVLTDTQCSVLV